MAKWWETDPDLPTEVADFQRRAAYYREVLKVAQTTPRPRQQQARQARAQQQLSAQQQRRLWAMPAWLELLRRRPWRTGKGAEPTPSMVGGGAIPPAAEEPAAVVEPALEEQPPEDVWAERGGTSFEQIVPKTYEERGAEFWKKIFTSRAAHWGEETGGEKTPRWLSQFNAAIEQMLSGAAGRVIRAYEKPEQRALMGGEPGGLGTYEQLSQEQTNWMLEEAVRRGLPTEEEIQAMAEMDPEEAERLRGELYVGRQDIIMAAKIREAGGFFEKALGHIGKAQEQATRRAAYYLDETLSEEERAKLKQELDAQRGYVYPWMGEMWKDLTTTAEGAASLEQALAVGTQVFIDPAYQVLEVGTALDIITRPESRNLQVEQWYPLTKRASSLYWANIKLGVKQAVAQMRGELSAEEYRGTLENRADVIALALIDIAEGTATAEEIALAYENLGAEFVGQFIVDPWNMLFVGAGPSGQRLAHLSEAYERMTDVSAVSPAARDALKLIDDAVDAGDLTALRQMEKTLASRKISIPRKILNKLGEDARSPVALIPEAKAARDLEDITIVLAPAIDIAETGDDAIQLLRLWAEDPSSLRPVFGRVPQSRAGLKAQTILRATIDNLAQLPSARAVPFNAARFWSDLDNVVRATLLEAYGFKEPGPVLSFFLNYKRLQSEFYLNPAMGGLAYGVRNTLGDMSGMFVDGVLSFEKRANIEDYFRAFSTGREDFAPTTRRIMTEGAENIEGLTGSRELKSIFPGAVGEWSKKGQKLTRHGEFFGRLPFGEEPRYLRALYAGHKWYWNEYALKMFPDLPTSAITELGSQAEHLRRMIALEPNLGVRRQLLTEFLEGRKGVQFEPTQYLTRAEMNAISPEAIGRVRRELRKLGRDNSVDDVHRIIEDVVRAIDEDEAAKLAMMEQLPPSLHVTTDASEVEAAEDLVQNLRDIVARTGDKKQAQRLAEIEEAIPKVEKAFEEARIGAIEDLMTAPDENGLEILMQANARVEDSQVSWRQLLDETRAKAIAEYRQPPNMRRPAEEIWAECFQALDEGWTAKAHERIGIYQEASTQLERLRGGESLESILGQGSRTRRAEQWLLKASELPEPPPNYIPGNVYRGANEDAKFARLLEWNRAKLDNARINAWRSIYGTEPENYGRMLDLFDSAERDIEMWGKQTAGEVRRLLEETKKEIRRLSKVHKDPHLLQLAVDQAYEAYWAKRHDSWNKFWRGAEQRWQIAERDVLLENWAYGQRMEPPVTPPKTRGPRRPKVGPVQAGDDEIVKMAVLKRDVDWTADERKAIERWVAAGQKLPEKELPIVPGIRGAPPYTRSQLVADLKAIPNVAEEQVDAFIEVLDRVAKTWSKQTGYSPEKFYAMTLAGAHRGNAAEFTLFQQAEHYLDPRFKEWFGASVVRDGPWFDVKPKTLYRGQRHDVDFFRVSDEGFIWTTDSPEYADFISTKMYGRELGQVPEGAQTYPVYMKMENPIDLSTARLDLEMDEFEQELVLSLRACGIEYGVDTTTINAIMPVPGWGGLFGQYVTLDEPFLWVRYNRDALLEAARDRGFDGIILHERFPLADGTIDFANSYIAFEPNQVKSVWNRAPTESKLLLYQDSEFAPQWWYGIERTIDAKMPNRASIEQISNILNKGGVRKEELRWTGIEWWLNNQEGMVTKEEVLSFLEGNRLEVGEVMRGGNEYLEAAERAYVEADRALQEAVTALRRKLLDAGEAEQDVNRFVHGAILGTDDPGMRRLLEELAPDEYMDVYTAANRRGIEGDILLNAKKGAPRTQWGKYVEPGAVQGSYRELELTLPKWVGEDAAKVKELRRLNDEAWPMYNRLGNLRHQRRAARDWNDLEALNKIEPELRELEKQWKALHEQKRALDDSLGKPLDYQEPHWGSDKNVVAHVRWDERVGPEGERVLFIEEGQSAWHQTAREKGGYAPAKWPEDWRIDPITKENGYRWEKKALGSDELIPIDPNETLEPRIWIDEAPLPVDRLRLTEAGWIQEDIPPRWRLWEGSTPWGTFDSLEDARAAGLSMAPDPKLYGVFDGKGALRSTGSSPELARDALYRELPMEAPFATSWDELFLKRMMRYAAENDYDTIAWTSGVQQVRRYPMADKRAVVTRLDWQRQADGTIRVTGYDDLQYRNKQVFSTTFDAEGKGTVIKTETTLEKAFGKELAEDIMTGATGYDYSAEVGELIVGDVGLADLYDRIFPYSARKLIKRWQGDVGEMTLDFGRAPQYRVSHGMQGWVVIDEAGAVATTRELPTASHAQAWIGEQQVKFGERQVHGFRINPGMRRDLLNEGLALYQPSTGASKAAMSVLEDGRALMRFFEGADFSSVVHEFGHVLRRILPDDELRIVEKWVGITEGDFSRLYDLALEHQELAGKATRTAEEEARMEKLAPLSQQYRQAEEQFANGFVRYLTEGIAPIPELQLPFRKIKQWLMDIYREIRGSSIDVKLSDEIRGVFDRLIAGEEAWPRQPVAGAAGGAPPGGGVPLFQKAEPVGSDAFGRWFGDSKTVGEGGEPLRLYRGMDVDVKSFTPSQEGLIWTTDNSEYAEFIASKAYGQEAAGGRYAEGAQIYPVYVKLENPIDLSEISANLHPTLMQQRLREVLARYNIRYGIDVSAIGKPAYGKLGKVDVNELYQWVRHNAERLRHFADEGGYDGIILSERFRTASGKSSTAKSYVAFEPNQVKSVWNAAPTESPLMLHQKADDLFDAKALAQAAIDRIPEEGWTLSLQGEPHPGGGWAVSLPGAERPLVPGEIDVEHIVQWLDEHAQDFAADPTLKFGGWTEGDNVVLDISTIIQNADEAMVRGWEWRQRAIFNFSTWESVDVTHEAAQEAAKRLGIALQRAPGEPAIPLVGKRVGMDLYQPGAVPEQRGLWDYDPDNWAEYRRGMGQVGATPGPVPADLLQRETEATRGALRKIENGLARDWDQWQDVLASQQVQRDLDSWFTDYVVPNWFEQRATAFDFARQEANFALLDYSHRYNFDQWLSCIIPYHYWFTRAGWNWAKRLASRPGMLGAYIRMMDGLKLANERAGRRRRFAQMFAISAPWLPDWMGDTLHVDPRSMMAPFSQIFQGDWDDAEESKHGLRAAFDTARQFGLRPYHIWDWLYQTGKFAQAGSLMGLDPEQAQQYLGPEYQGNFPNILPQTGVIRGATALAREMGAEGIPPGGINIEAPVRRLLGLPSGEIWDPYRINRMLGNIAAERPSDKQLAVATLRAQELMQRDTETQTGKPWLEDSALAQLTAQELGWSATELKEAQEVLIQALQRAALERAVGSLGWLTGPRLAVEPAGERAQLEMAEEARGAIWGPEQPEGSRGAYEQFKRENWAMYPRATQYNVIPGEQEYEAMDPGARANWLILREQKEKLHAMFDEAVDAALRREPWNWDARGDLEDQRRVSIAELEKKFPLPDFDGDLPAYLYGMNPGEMWDAAVEKILYAWQARRPDPGKFELEDEGVDWDAYNKAEEKWFAQLPKVFSFGAPQGGAYQGMDPATAMRNFDQRFDSPLEAAHKVYESEIAAPAWASYNKIKAQWEKQWPGMADLEDQYFQLNQNSRRAYIKTHPELAEYWDWKDQQGSAYEQTVGKVPRINATALIPAILKQYQARGWTEEQLKQELAGVVFPSLAKQQDLKRAQREQAAAPTAAPSPAGDYAQAPTAAGDYAQPPGYTPEQLEYLKERAKAEWERNQGRYGGGWGKGSYGGSQYPRWRPPSVIRGGPFRH